MSGVVLYEWIGAALVLLEAVRSVSIAALAPSPQVADDPDDADDVYSSGDTIEIRFDRATDRGGGGVSGTKRFVDSLVEFSEPLAYDYSGEGGAEPALTVCLCNLATLHR